jgi:hypothetical protein
VSLSTVVIAIFLDRHLAFTHSSISFVITMSHQSESSTAAINTRYAMRDRGLRDDSLLAAALQADEYDDIDRDEDDNDDTERDMHVHDDDNDDDDDDGIEHGQDADENDMAIDDSIGGGKNEAAAVVSAINKRKKHTRSNNQPDDNVDWSTQPHDIVLPFSRSRHHYGNNKKLDKSSMHILQLFISKQLINKWVSYTNEYATKYKQVDLDTCAAELYAFIGILVYMGI